MPSYPCGNGPHHSFTPPEQPETDQDTHTDMIGDFCRHCTMPVYPFPLKPYSKRMWEWRHSWTDAIKRHDPHHLEFPADAAQKLGLADDTFLYIEPTERQTNDHRTT